MIEIAASRPMGRMLAALLLVAGSGCGVLGHEAERSLDGGLEVPAGVRVAAADFVHGDMQVDGTDGTSLSLHAEVTVSATSQQIADEVAAALRIVFPVDGDVLRVVVAPADDRWPADSYTIAVTSRLVVPRGLGLDLSTTHGDLSLADVAGDVSAGTTHGNLTVSRTRGELSLASTHGWVELDDVSGGPVSVSTTHGDLTARGLQAAFELVTTHGDVDLELGERADGRSSVTTTHGDVTCRFAARARWDVDASTSHDLVRSELPGLELSDEGRSGILRVGDAEAAGRLEIRTTHGEVQLALADGDDERM